MIPTFVCGRACVSVSVAAPLKPCRESNLCLRTICLTGALRLVTPLFWGTESPRSSTASLFAQSNIVLATTARPENGGHCETLHSVGRVLVLRVPPAVCITNWVCQFPTRALCSGDLCRGLVAQSMHACGGAVHTPHTPRGDVAPWACAARRVLVGAPPRRKVHASPRSTRNFIALALSVSCHCGPR